MQRIKFFLFALVVLSVLIVINTSCAVPDMMCDEGKHIMHYQYTPATCMTAAYEVYYCNNCDFTYTILISPPTGVHMYKPAYSLSINSCEKQIMKECEHCRRKEIISTITEHQQLVRELTKIRCIACDYVEEFPYHIGFLDSNIGIGAIVRVYETGIFSEVALNLDGQQLKEIRIYSGDVCVFSQVMSESFCCSDATRGFPFDSIFKLSNTSIFLDVYFEFE